MTSNRYPRRSIPNPDYVYVREIRQNWLKERPKDFFPISIGESRLAYRMTLGSIYYEREITKVEAKEPETEIGIQSAVFLKTKRPDLWRKWLIIKHETNSHLDHVAGLWRDYILSPVDKAISELKQEFKLAKYIDMRNKDEFYVEDNIKEGVYLEIQHYATTGNKLGLFKIGGDNKHVGNGFTFIVSSNEQALRRFIDYINKVIYSEKVIDRFKYADVRKSEIEAKVFAFKKDLDTIYV